MKRCNNCFNIIEDTFAFCPHCGYKDGTPPEEPYYLCAGVTLQNRYIVGQAIGFGGFGITYKAYDTILDSVIALKEFFPSGIANREPGKQEVLIYAKKREHEFHYFRTRFIKEARNLAKFNSENNIVNVYEFFEANNTAYIAMEYLDGEGLNKYLHANNDKVSVDFALKIGNAIAEALGKLHEVGIIHRDISPDNIYLCSNGKIKLIDFGAARFSRDENKQLTVILKPGFAPPEQYEQINKQGPWTDIYALGATLYYILTGQLPEESTNRKINDTLSDPIKLNPEIPEQLSRVIMKAMAIDINLRFKSTKEFLSALNGQTTIATIAQEKKKRTQKRSMGIAAAAILIAGGIFTAVFGVHHEKDENTLSDCAITVWYCKENYESENILKEENVESYKEMMNSSEDKAYSSIISQFQESYPNVEVTLQGFEENEYIKKLKSGEELPNIYEYIDVGTQPQLLELNEVYSSREFDSCSILCDANDYYESRNYLPLGFTAPMVFVAKDVKREDKRPVDASEAFSDDERFITDEKGFMKTYRGGRDHFSDSAFKQFSNKKAKYYGTQSSNFIKIRETMPAKYKIAPCEAKNVYCMYSNVWAANDIDKNENKAAERFLTFMLSDNAQGAMYMENENESFPVNDGVLDIYVSVNDEFEGFFDNKDSYKFEK